MDDDEIRLIAKNLRMNMIGKGMMLKDVRNNLQLKHLLPWVEAKIMRLIEEKVYGTPFFQTFEWGWEEFTNCYDAKGERLKMFFKMLEANEGFKYQIVIASKLPHKQPYCPKRPKNLDLSDEQYQQIVDEMVHWAKTNQKTLEEVKDHLSLKALLPRERNALMQQIEERLKN